MAADVIQISGDKGLFAYDPSTERIFRDNQLMPTDEATPVYAYFGKKHLPQFAGIYLRSLNVVLTLSGNAQIVTGDENLIQ